MMLQQNLATLTWLNFCCFKLPSLLYYVTVAQVKQHVFIFLRFKERKGKGKARLVVLVFYLGMSKDPGDSFLQDNDPLQLISQEQ